MPREYLRYFFLSSGSSLTLSIAARTSSSPTTPFIDASIWRFLKPLYESRKAGFSINIPMLLGNVMSLPSSSPSISILPPVGSISPAIRRISMVFPDPFTPFSPIISPDSNTTLTLSVTVFPLMTFVTFSSTILVILPVLPA